MPAGVSVGVVVAGHEQVAANFRRIASQSDAKVNGVVRTYGHLLRTKVMRNASGRPGPNVITGDYRRSIQVTFTRDGSTFRAIVGTNSPQGRRLEFGFTGMDSLGRRYSQPPYPHFRPALRDVGREFQRAVRRTV